MFGVPQRPIAWSHFFNVYTCDMFSQVSVSEFPSYTDDKTPFASGQIHEKLMNSFQGTLNILFERYQEIYFEAIADKFHLFLSSCSNQEMTIANYNVAFSKLKRVVIDSEVTFAKHIKNFYRRTHQQLHALARVDNFDCRKVLLSYENICFFSNLIIVLLHGCVTAENVTGNLIDCKKGLYDTSVTIHTRNLQYLKTVTFKDEIACGLLL